MSAADLGSHSTMLSDAPPPLRAPQGRQLAGATVAGKYRLERKLGEGGIGEVHLGEHLWTKRRVAVKLLGQRYAQDPESLKRFMQEARAAAALKHPNVVDILDMGQDEALGPFLVMEFLEGESLADHLKRVNRLPSAQAAALLAPIVDVLRAAHAHGMVHRDLKPDNIFLARTAAGTVPKLLDFGIAKLITPALALSVHTAPGTVMGTPAYMAPEQIQGAEATGPATDVWAMGVILYECITGQLPFGGTNLTSLFLAIARGEYRSARSFQGLVAEEKLLVAIESALVVDPAKRCQSMALFRGFLGDSKPSALPALPPPRYGNFAATPALPKHVSWQRKAASMACGLLVVVGLWSLFPRGEAAAGEQPDRYLVTFTTSYAANDYATLVVTTRATDGAVVAQKRIDVSHAESKLPLTLQLVDRDPRESRIEAELYDLQGRPLALERSSKRTELEGKIYLDMGLNKPGTSL